MTVATLSQDERDLAKIVFVIRQLCEGRTNGTVREVITAPRTYYVATTGSDTANDGKTASTPFLTINHARAVVAGLDLNNQANALGYAAEISVGAGTFAESALDPILGGGGITVSTPFIGGNVIIRGAGKGTVGTGAGGTIIATTNGPNVLCVNGAKIAITGVALQTSGGTYACLYARDRGKIEFSKVATNDVQFLACGDTNCLAETGAQIEALGPSTIAGNCTYHAKAFNGGQVRNLQQGNVYSGSPAAGQFWFDAIDNGTIYVAGYTWSGTPTGYRYHVRSGGTIDTNTSSDVPKINPNEHFLPGQDYVTSPTIVGGLMGLGGIYV